MRMDFPTYLPVWGGSLEKPSKETKNNYRKPENQSQHNDFPICGKNKRQKRNTKGILSLLTSEPSGSSRKRP